VEEFLDLAFNFMGLDYKKHISIDQLVVMMVREDVRRWEE